MNDIEVYSGWGDSGRYQQAYTIKFSYDTAPATFLTLTTVSAYPSALTERGAETMLTPTATPFLATNVAAVEIEFNTVANSWTGYREFVVNGVQAPEPSTYALMALGAGGLALLLRRRTQANS